MTDEERRLFLDEGVVPDGWVWCPDCDGEGTITRMSAAYPHDETTYTCERCAAERGIVPADEARRQAATLEIRGWISDGEWKPSVRTEDLETIVKILRGEQS